MLLKSDAPIAAVFLIVASLVGLGYVRAMRQTHRLPDVTGLEQQVFGAAAMNACGRGLTTPILPMAAAPDTPASHRLLIEFLTQRRERIVCGDIPADVPTAPIGGMQGASRYLLTIIEAPWMIAGPTWRAFDWLAGTLFGISIALAYLFGAVVMGRIAAALVAAAFMLSPLHMSNIVDVRDYSKTPFFVATLLIVALLIIRPRKAAAVVALSAIGGLVAGFGFGVRTDIALNLVLVMAGAVIFLPGAFAASWKVRLLAGVAAIAAFATVAAPILASPSSGSNLWHWALLGYGHDFDSALGVAPAPYETGYFYDDSYVASIVDAYRGRTTGATGQVSVDMPEYTDASRAYYRLMLATFPADALLRSEAALVRILSLPFSGLQSIPPDAMPSWIGGLIALRGRLLRLVAPLAVPIFAGVVLAVSLRSLRVALAILTIVVMLGMYPAIQFQMRHFFHLELLPLTLLGVCLQAPALVGPLARGAWIRGAALAAALVVLAIGPLMALRLFQQRSATALLARYESAPVVSIPETHAPLANGVVRIASADALLPHDSGDRSMRSEQVVLETAATGCTVPRVAVTFRYAVSTQGFDYTRTFNVPVEMNAGPTRVFFTVYDSGQSSPLPHHFVFDRIEVPAEQERCIARVARFVHPGAFPLLLPAVLPPGWRGLPLHQTLRGWERRLSTDATHE